MKESQTERAITCRRCGKRDYRKGPAQLCRKCLHELHQERNCRPARPDHYPRYIFLWFTETQNYDGVKALP